MSGAVCPACGIAVVPGYVRCPKCHKPLPRFARNSISPVGGTVVETTSKLPIYIAAGVAAVIAILVARHFVIGAFEDYRNKSAAIGHRDGGPELSAVAQPAPPPPVANIVTPVPTEPTATAGTVVHADDVARALKARLDKQRLWSTVQVIGDHVEVRSATCNDSGMKPAIEQSAAQFHAAGLTRLRCLEQSGAVVFARAL